VSALATLAPILTSFSRGLLGDHGSVVVGITVVNWQGVSDFLAPALRCGGTSRSKVREARESRLDVWGPAAGADIKTRSTDLPGQADTRKQGGITRCHMRNAS
jgi:hypothetical protein